MVCKRYICLFVLILWAGSLPLVAQGQIEKPVLPGAVHHGQLAHPAGRDSLSLLASAGVGKTTGALVPASAAMTTGAPVPASAAMTIGDTASAGTSVSTEKLMTQRCPWSESLNAASLLCFDYHDRVARAWMGYDHTSGDYRLFQQASTVDRYGFYTNGWSAVGRWRFYGNFSYTNENSPGTRWASIMEPYNGNPYSVGDSVGGTYSREYFGMEGKAALPLGSHFSAGIDVKYKAGVGTKRKDPRPENTLTAFEISPGILWRAGGWKVGGNFRYETGKEDIEFTSVTGNKFDLFNFRGLGAFSTTMEDDGRYTETELFGGGIQAGYGNGYFSNLTAVNLSRQTTGIKRGSTYPLQVVFLDSYTTEVSTLFLFYPEEENIRRLKLWYSNSKMYGEEPVVEPKLEEVSWQWSTAAKYTLYWQETTRVGARWSYYKVRDPRHFNWGCSLGGDYASDETTYYFVPEFNRQQIDRFTTEAVFEKGLLSGKNELVIALNGGYRLSPYHRLEIVQEPTLRKGVHLDFLEHDYEYQTVDVWETGITLDYGREIRMGKTPFQFFLEVVFNRVSDDFTGTTARNSFRVNAGINF